MIKYYIIVLLILIAAGCGKYGEKSMLTTEEKLKFKATVRNVVTIQRFSGKAIAGHFSPRFVVMLELSKDDAIGLEYFGNRRLNFTIHSPTKLFASDWNETKGKTAIFSYDAKRHYLTFIDLYRKSQQGK